MTSVALFKLADEYLAAAATLADLDLPPEVVADTLEGLAGEVEAKATNVALFSQGLKATIAAMKEAEDAMAKRRKAAEARHASLMAYLLAQMERTGITKIEAPQLRIAIRENPESVEVFDEAQVPAALMTTPEPPAPRPDKAAIKAALQAGQDVPGCRLTRGKRVALS